jgi:thioredoxin 1
MAFEFTDENFEETVLNNDGVAVVDLWAPWCGPCRLIGPIIEQLAAEHKDVLIGKMNVDDNPEVPTNFNVRGIPTILFFKNGQLVDKQVGMTTKQVLAQKIQHAMAHKVG